jgi:hypothetical protein
MTLLYVAAGRVLQLDRIVYYDLGEWSVDTPAKPCSASIADWLRSILHWLICGLEGVALRSECLRTEGLAEALAAAARFSENFARFMRATAGRGTRSPANTITRNKDKWRGISERAERAVAGHMQRVEIVDKKVQNATEFRPYGREPVYRISPGYHIQ